MPGTTDSPPASPQGAPAPVRPASSSSPRRSPRGWDVAMLGVALLGLIFAGSATSMYLGSSLGLGCSADEPESCMVIYLPSYAAHVGVPIPYLGLLGYGAIFLLSLPLALSTAARITLVNGRRALVGVAALASVYFVAFQGFFLGYFCPLCSSSAIAVAVLVTLDLTRPSRLGETVESFDVTAQTATARASSEWARATSGRWIATLAPAVVLGTWWLSAVWNPIADLEAKKTAFLAQFRSSEQFPKTDDYHRRTRPTLVFVNRVGCPFCAEFFGREMQHPEILAQLRRFDIYVATITTGGVMHGAMILDRAPSIGVYPLRGSPSRIVGFRPAEEVQSILHAVPSAAPPPPPTPSAPPRR